MNLEAIYLLTSSLNKYLQKNTINESDLKSIQSQLDILFYHLPLPTYNCIPARLERLTINERLPQGNNDRINEIKYLKYPPKESVTKFGRCNILNQPILYGSFNFHTVIDELKPNVGKVITHTEWALKKEAPLKLFPIFFITNIGNGPHNPMSLDIKELHEHYASLHLEGIRKCFDLSMEFLAKCFAKEVDRNNHFDYFLSAYISNKILSIDSLNYDGIIYPSVQARLGCSNMAIRPKVFDEKFKLIEVCHEINLIENGKSGINHVQSRSTNFDLENEIIIWED